MEAVFLNSVSIAPRRPILSFDHRRDQCCLNRLSWKKKKKNIICCQSTENVTNSIGLASVLKERLVFSPNGKTQEVSLANDLMTPNGTATTLMDEEIGIVRFLKGKGFLITGATGFVAKVLIEKILRTVPDVGKIFLLIKAKNKEEAMNRLMNEIINTELFKCLQEIHGKSFQAFMLSKLVPVLGNVRDSNLGMESELAAEIAGEVDVIVNSAANTTFDERYDVALDINTRGPCRLMNFAKRCKKLKLLLHVSTAYVNGQRQGRILEKPFCIGDSIARERISSESSSDSIPILDVEGEIKLALDSVEDFQDNELAQKMKEMGLQRAKNFGWQDTYVFTKAMGEMLIENMRGDIPVVIIRPSVIESTFKEPFPGWMEGNRMMDPIVLYYGKGQLTGFLVDPKGVLDVVPADMVVNATLAAMAKHGAAGKRGMNIYHIASSVTNPLVFQDLAGLLFEHFSSSPCLDSLGRPIHVPTMKLFHSMDNFSSHIWSDAIQRSGQATMADSHKKLSQRLENICKKSVEQAKYLANIYKPYTFYSGRFDTTNTQKLMEDMSEEEKKSFGFDVGSIDWKDYIPNIHIPGLRRHVMKGRGMCVKSLSENTTI
ncbi:jojoba acyl CoA reductase-related male sterility protein [Tasmannia lanceolata]|uniref:jojoba acyl CoA reductase-related male sterility protein n=1 Tax=Tasmannia lanceolata TaxID=3420 RepID=UPI004063AFFF